MNGGASFFKPSWRKVISDLLGNKVRTLLVVASIAVGVFAVGMIAGAYYIIPGDMNASFQSANPANIQITTGAFDHTLHDAIENVDGVLAAEGSRTISARLQTGPDEWTSFSLIARSSYDSGRVDSQRHISGLSIPPKDQVILEKKAADKYHIQPGDVLTIELQDNTTRQMTVAGISQDLTSGISGMMNSTKGYIIEDTIEWLHQPDYFNQLYITVKDQPNDPAYIQAVYDRVVDKLKKSNREVYQFKLSRQDTHPMDSILQALLRILLILGILIVFLSGSLISNTLTALLNQHMQQIGIMKLVGARRAQIVAMYLSLITAFSLIALVGAIPLGSWAAYGLSSFAANLIGFPLRGFRAIPQAVTVQIVIALAVPLLAGILPVLSGARVTVKKAITSASMTEVQPKHGLIDRLLASLRGFSRPMLVSVRNTFRRKGRLALTLLTLTLGGAIFISVFNVQVSLNNKINQITKYFGADVNLDLGRAYPASQVGADALAVPGVARVEPWTLTQADMLNPAGDVIDNISVMAPPAGSELVKPILMQGRWIMPGDENAITVNEAFLRKYPTLKVGDTLRLKFGDRKANWEIVGIFQFTGVKDRIAYTSYDYLSRYLNQPSKTSTYRIVASDHSLEAQAALSQALDVQFREKGYQISNIEAGGAFTKSMTEYIGILTAFLVIMALLTAAVGSIGMAGTLSMNVMERTREIGVLRAIGAHDQVILRLVLVEGLLIGMISFLLGAVLSFPITSVLAEVISQAIFDAPANFAFTLQGFGIWLGVVLLLSVVASMIPARTASRMTIREVLSYE